MNNYRDQRPQGDRYRSGQRGEKPQKQLPVPNPMKYFIDSQKQQLDEKLVDEKAREWARKFETLKTTQMRRFYDELKTIERKIMLGKDENEQETNFSRNKSQIILLKAKTIYAQKRDFAPEAFSQFIFDHVASLNDLKDFRAFLKIFEAVVAFHKFFAKE